LPQNGAGAKPANSITFIPFKAILVVFDGWKQRKNEIFQYNEKLMKRLELSIPIRTKINYLINRKI
jgi:hypothetical protein